MAKVHHCRQRKWKLKDTDPGVLGDRKRTEMCFVRSLVHFLKGRFHMITFSVEGKLEPQTEYIIFIKLKA